MTDWICAVSDAPDGVVISISVTAGARRNAFPRGYNPWRCAILCQVAEPAVDGRANKAVIEVLAERLGVPAQNIQIRSGAHAPHKKVLIRGVSREVVEERLRQLF
ncbi:MAG: DUF167 domain-containing protein [Methanomicrobiales archaeon]|nr:DUF167 domain-containing protein [Methanomicrobiales archaeon]MDI6876459.1 DUF167 domain-containing protein [Methanomicrobiales archaeon]